MPTAAVVPFCDIDSCQERAAVRLRFRPAHKGDKDFILHLCREHDAATSSVPSREVFQ